MSDGAKPFIEVAAGLILRPDGALLLAQRPADKPWPGWWELPGGKIEAGETTLQALARELKEELGIEVTKAAPWVTYTHEYPKNIVRLAFCRVTAWNGEPAGLEGQTLAWARPGSRMEVGPLLPATEPPLRWIQLPTRYLITAIGGRKGLPAFLDKLSAALAQGVRLVQFRESAWMQESVAEAYAAFTHVLRLCRQAGALCLVNSCHPESWRAQADGVHYRAADARRLASAPGAAAVRADASRAAKDGIDPAGNAAGDRKEKAPGLIAVSAHDKADLQAARELGADFAVLGHVLDTPSHPGQPGMGWVRFAELAADAGLPVYAIGGQSAATLDEAWRHGAHGIAGIRGLAG